MPRKPLKLAVAPNLHPVVVRFEDEFVNVKTRRVDKEAFDEMQSMARLATGRRWRQWDLFEALVEVGLKDPSAVFAAARGR